MNEASGYGDEVANAHCALRSGGLKSHRASRAVDTRVAHCIPLVHVPSALRSSQISIEVTPSPSVAAAVYVTVCALVGWRGVCNTKTAGAPHPLRRAGMSGIKHRPKGLMVFSSLKACLT